MKYTNDIQAIEMKILLQDGERLFGEGNVDLAKKCFENIIAADPHNFEALNNMGVIHFTEGRYQQAIPFFHKALQINENYGESIDNLAKSLEANGSFIEALELFQKRIKLGTVNTDILNSMGNCFVQVNDLNTAYLVYKESLQIDSKQILIQQLVERLRPFNNSQDKKKTLSTKCNRLEQIGTKRNYRIQIISFSDFEANDERRLRWGDYWVKHELEKELRDLGHTTTNKEPDIVLHLFGAPLKNLPKTAYNVIWVHSHPDWVTSEVLSNYDQIFCLSPQFIRMITSWGFDAELLIGGSSRKPLKSKLKYDIVFVANAKGSNGRKIISDLGDLTNFPYNLKIWGEGWEGILPEKFYGGMYYSNEDLGKLYASSLICLNDHYEDMRNSGFINPRIFDILASGGFCISDNLAGLEEILEDAVPRYTAPEDLKTLIDYYISNPHRRDKLVKKGCRLSLSYSFKKMAKQLIESIESQITSQSKLAILKTYRSKSKHVKLDLGCGKLKQEGFIGLDIKVMPGVDIVCDVAKGISLKDNSVQFVIADNLLEHIGDELIDVVNDIWRVCAPDAKVKLIVPGVHTSAAFQDPTHKRFFVQETFDYFNAEHERWKLYGSSYGIKPFKILSVGLRETDQRFIEVEMVPVKDKAISRQTIERQEQKVTEKSANATKLAGKNLLVSFGFVPHSTATYFIRALKNKSINVRSCGPADKTTLLKTWTNNQITHLAPLHDVITDRDTSIVEVINSFKDGWYPNLFLWVESSMNFPNFPSKISELRCPSAGYFIDSHTKLDWHLKFASQFDYVFVAQKAYVPSFKKAGCQRVFWLPLACDPEIHGKHKVQKQHDISFVGNVYSGIPLYERRNNLLVLLQNKYDLKVEQKFFEDMAESFSRARLVFNISARDDLNMRVFEALASGSLLLTDRAAGSGLTSIFQDKQDLVIYQDENNLIELVDYYLKNPEEAERIALSGMKKVLSHHTYEHRVVEIFNKIEDAKQSDTRDKSQPAIAIRSGNVAMSEGASQTPDLGLTLEQSCQIKNKDGHLRILAAFAHFNWEDYNLQPALEEFGEVLRLRWPPYNQYEKEWHFSNKQSFNIRFLEAIKKEHEAKPIDLLFAYVSGRLIFPSTIRTISLMGIPTLSMCLDDRTKFAGRLEPSGYAGMIDIANAFSLCWTSTQDAVRLYESVGARVIYLPEGANPMVYKPLDIPFDIDVSFVGQCYGKRPEVIEFLKRKGIHVEVFGRGWPSGEISVERMVQIYNRSRINIGFAMVGDCEDVFCLKGRDFEVPMSGGLYFTQHHPELKDVYNIGKEIVCYHDLEDLADKTKYYLKHPEEADKVRKAGHERAIREHTWVQRFERAFQEMGLLQKKFNPRKNSLENRVIQEMVSPEMNQLLKKGEAFYAGGHIQEAKDYFQQVLSVEPDHVEACNNLGVILFQEGNLDNAIHLFSKVYSLDDHYLEAVENIGKCYQRKGDYLEAIQWFKKASNENEKSADILNCLGNCYIQLGDLINARKIYAQSLQLDADQEIIKNILSELQAFPTPSGTKCL